MFICLLHFVVKKNDELKIVIHLYIVFSCVTAKHIPVSNLSILFILFCSPLLIYRLTPYIYLHIINSKPKNNQYQIYTIYNYIIYM